MSKEEKKRNSILKKTSSKVSVASPTATSTTTTISSFVKSKRISFSCQKTVKEFLPGHDNATVWLSSYEELDNDQSPLEFGSNKTTKIPIIKQAFTNISSCESYNESNSDVMTLRNSKVVLKQTHERRSRIAKPSRRKSSLSASLSAEHDKENEMIIMNKEELKIQKSSSSLTQVVEMDISVEETNNKEMRIDNRTILNDDDNNKNHRRLSLELSPVQIIKNDETEIRNYVSSIKNDSKKNTMVKVSDGKLKLSKISVDVEMQPIEALRNMQIENDNATPHSVSMNEERFSDLLVFPHEKSALLKKSNLLQENHSITATQLSDLSLYQHDELMKSDSLDFYTSFALNTNDIHKIKAWRNGDLVNPNNSTSLNIYSFQSDKSGNMSTLSLHSTKKLEETTNINNDNEDNHTRRNNDEFMDTTPICDENNAENRTSKILPQEIEESISEARENSTRITSQHQMDMITNENDMKLENDLSTDYYQQQEQQQQQTQISSESKKKRFILHLENDQVDEISLEEIQKGNDKVVYTIKNQNKRMTILPNDRMEIDQNQLMNSNLEFRNDARNQVENRRTVVSSQNMNDTLSLQAIAMENNTVAEESNYQNNISQKSNYIKINKKRQTVLYPDGGRIDEEQLSQNDEIITPTELNKDGNQFEIITKPSCKRKSIHMCEDIELEQEKPFIENTPSITTIDKQKKNNELQEESMKINNLNKIQPHNKRHTVYLHEDIELEEELSFNCNTKLNVVNELSKGEIRNEVSNSENLMPLSRLDDSTSRGNHLKNEMNLSEESTDLKSFCGEDRFPPASTFSNSQVREESKSHIRSEKPDRQTVYLNEDIDLEEINCEEKLRKRSTIIENDNEKEIMVRRSFQHKNKVVTTNEMEENTFNENYLFNEKIKRPSVISIQNASNRKIDRNTMYLNNNIEVEESFNGNYLFNNCNENFNRIYFPTEQSQDHRRNDENIEMKSSSKIMQNDETSQNEYQMDKVKSIYRNNNRCTINFNEDIEIDESVTDNDDEKVGKLNSSINQSNKVELCENKSILHHERRNDDFSLLASSSSMKNNEKSSLYCNQNENLSEQKYGDSMNSLLKLKKRETHYTIQDIDLDEDEEGKGMKTEFKSYSDEIEMEKNYQKACTTRKTLFTDNSCDLEEKVIGNHLQGTFEMNKENSIRNDESVAHNSMKLHENFSMKSEIQNNEGDEDESNKEIEIEVILSVDMDIDEVNIENECPNNMNNEVLNNVQESERKTVIFPKPLELDLTCKSTTRMLPKIVISEAEKTYVETMAATTQNPCNSFSQSKCDDEEIKNCNENLDEENEDKYALNASHKCEQVEDNCKFTITENINNENEPSTLLHSQNISVEGTSKLIQKSILKTFLSSAIASEQYQRLQQNDEELKSSAQKRNRSTFAAQSPCHNYYGTMMQTESPIPHQPSKKEKNSEMRSSEKKKHPRSRLPIFITRVNPSNKRNIFPDSDATDNSKSRRTVVFTSPNGGGQKMEETFMQNDIKPLPSNGNSSIRISSPATSPIQIKENSKSFKMDISYKDDDGDAKDENVNINVNTSDVSQSITIDDESKEMNIWKNQRKTIHFNVNNDDLEIEISSQNEKNHDKSEYHHQNHCKRSLYHENIENNKSLKIDSSTIANAFVKVSPGVVEMNSIKLINDNFKNNLEDTSIQKSRNVRSSLFLNNELKEKFNIENIEDLSGIQFLNVDYDNTTRIEDVSKKNNNDVDNVVKLNSNDTMNTNDCIPLRLSEVNSSTELHYINIENIRDNLTIHSSSEFQLNATITLSSSSTTSSTTATKTEAIEKDISINNKTTIFDDIDNATNNSANDIEKTHISLIDSILSNNDDVQSSLKLKEKSTHKDFDQQSSSTLKVPNIRNSVKNAIAPSHATPTVVKSSSTTTTTTKESPSLLSSSSLSSSSLMLCKKCKKCKKCDITLLNDTTLSDFAIEKLPEKYELDFSGYERFKNMPTLNDVIREHKKSMELLDELSSKMKNNDEKLNLSEITYGPEAPSFEFLLNNLMKENINSEKYDLRLKPCFPLTPTFEILLKNKFETEKSNWMLDDTYYHLGIIQIFHKTVHSHKLIFKFSQEALKSLPNKPIIFDEVEFKRNIDYKNWSTFDILYEIEFNRKIPFYIKSYCENSDKLFTFLDYFNEILVDSVKLSKELMKIVVRCDGNLQVNQKDELFIAKKTRKWIDAFTADERIFLIRILYHIDKISYKDIILPDLKEFNDSIKSLPTGLDFVKEFLVEPQNFLK